MTTARPAKEIKFKDDWKDSLIFDNLAVEKNFIVQLFTKLQKELQRNTYAIKSNDIYHIESIRQTETGFVVTLQNGVLFLTIPNSAIGQQNIDPEKLKYDDFKATSDDSFNIIYEPTGELKHEGPVYEVLAKSHSHFHLIKESETLAEVTFEKDWDKNIDYVDQAGSAELLNKIGLWLLKEIYPKLETIGSPHFTVHKVSLSGQLTMIEVSHGNDEHLHFMSKTVQVNIKNPEPERKIQKEHSFAQRNEAIAEDRRIAAREKWLERKHAKPREADLRPSPASHRSMLFGRNDPSKRYKGQHLNPMDQKAGTAKPKKQ